MHWADLSDAELRRRLIQRGIPIEHAILLVSQRERNTRAIEEIARVLAR